MEVDDGPGLAICPYSTGAVQARIPLGGQYQVVLKLTSDLDVTQELALSKGHGQELKESRYISASPVDTKVHSLLNYVAGFA